MLQTKTSLTLHGALRRIAERKRNRTCRLFMKFGLLPKFFGSLPRSKQRNRGCRHSIASIQNLLAWFGRGGAATSNGRAWRPSRNIGRKMEFCRRETNRENVSTLVFSSVNKYSSRMSTATVLLSVTAVFYLVHGQVNQIWVPHTPVKILLQLTITALLCLPLSILVAAGVTLLEWMWNQNRAFRQHS